MKNKKYKSTLFTVVCAILIIIVGYFCVKLYSNYKLEVSYGNVHTQKDFKVTQQYAKLMTDQWNDYNTDDMNKVSNGEVYLNNKKIRALTTKEKSELHLVDDLINQMADIMEKRKSQEKEVYVVDERKFFITYKKGEVLLKCYYDYDLKELNLQFLNDLMEDGKTSAVYTANTDDTIEEMYTDNSQEKYKKIIKCLQEKGMIGIRWEKTDDYSFERNNGFEEDMSTSLEKLNNKMDLKKIFFAKDYHLYSGDYINDNNYFIFVSDNIGIPYSGVKILMQ